MKPNPAATLACLRNPDGITLNDTFLNNCRLFLSQEKKQVLLECRREPYKSPIPTGVVLWESISMWELGHFQPLQKARALKETASGSKWDIFHIRSGKKMIKVQRDNWYWYYHVFSQRLFPKPFHIYVNSFILTISLWNRRRTIEILKKDKGFSSGPKI